MRERSFLQMNNIKEYDGIRAKIVLLSLDERPCNYYFPQKLFSHDDIDIVLPKKLGDKKDS